MSMVMRKENYGEDEAKYLPPPDFRPPSTWNHHLWVCLVHHKALDTAAWMRTVLYWTECEEQDFELVVTNSPTMKQWVFFENKRFAEKLLAIIRGLPRDPLGGLRAKQPYYEPYDGARQDVPELIFRKLEKGPHVSSRFLFYGKGRAE